MWCPLSQPSHNNMCSPSPERQQIRQRASRADFDHMTLFSSTDRCRNTWESDSLASSEARHRGSNAVVEWELDSLSSASIQHNNVGYYGSKLGLSSGPSLPKLLSDHQIVLGSGMVVYWKTHHKRNTYLKKR